MYLHKLYLRYSTSFGERESPPFHEEPETFISILTSTTSMHLEPFVMHSALPARPQPLVRSLQLVEVWPYREEDVANNLGPEFGGLPKVPAFRDDGPVSPVFLTVVRPVNQSSFSQTRLLEIAVVRSEQNRKYYRYFFTAFVYNLHNVTNIQQGWYRYLKLGLKFAKRPPLTYL